MSKIRYLHNWRPQLRQVEARRSAARHFADLPDALKNDIGITDVPPARRSD